MTDDGASFPSRFTAQVERDPAEEQPFGTTFTFNLLTIGNQLNAADDSTVFDFPTMPLEVDSNTCKGALLGICVERDGQMNMIGTAFVIGAGVAITSKHVLEESTLIELRDAKSRSILIGVNNDELMLWEIGAVSFNPDQDVAFLSISPISNFPNDNIYNYFGLSTGLPEFGERIRLIGFREQSSELGTSPDTPYRGTVDMYVSAGTVQEFLHNGRDATMLRSPCFRVDCHALSGMSGGVAVNERGLVVGVISTSFECEDPQITYVSWLVPAFNVSFPIEWPGGTERETSLLRETFLPASQARSFFIENPEGFLRLDGTCLIPNIDC